MANNTNPNFQPVLPYRLKRRREHGQNGWLEIVGKTRRLWKGHFYVNETQADSRESRNPKALVLGLRSAMTRKHLSELA
jgi:hypothetical protein